MTGNKSIWDEVQYQFQSGNMVVRLIYVNLAVFLVFALLRIPLFLFDTGGNLLGTIRSWVSLSSDPVTALTRPWTIITYQFMHAPLFGGGFLHILFNMLWLYWFGRILLEFHPQRKVLPLYLVGGVVAGLFFVILYAVFPVFRGETALLVGASGSVMAIVLATATLVPDYSIRLLLIGTVRLKWIALVAVLIDIISIPGGNTGGNFAHLGGALFGFLYIYLLRQGTDLLAPVDRFFDTVAGWISRTPRPGRRRMRVTSSSRRATRSSASAPTSGDDAADQAKVDAILDKISESGYDSLTKAEKDFLFRYSNRS